MTDAAIPAERSTRHPAEPSRTVAVVFSLIMPGLGHLHAGRWGRGLVIHLVYLAGLLSCGAVMWTSAQLLFTAMGSLVVLGRAFAVFDVLRIMRKGDATRASWLMMFLVGVALYAAGQAGTALVREHVVEAFSVPSGSMVPTLLAGDRFFVDKRAGVPVAGDIVAFRHEGQDYVKRVIATAGQAVRVDGGRVQIDGVPLPRCEVGEVEMEGSRLHLFVERLDRHLYLVAQEPGRPLATRTPPADSAAVTVPAGHVFVLGDNRDNSHDSRQIGPVPAGDVVGKVTRVFWGADGTSRMDVDVSGTGVHIPPELSTKRQALEDCRAQLLD